MAKKTNILKNIDESVFDSWSDSDFKKMAIQLGLSPYVSRDVIKQKYMDKK